ncbi:MAG: type 2 isopentenyl-diphosphate Delta-isomerase [Bacteroidetes bacterium]|nr:type 2 isopentenyl-diphosphate Delta-isomerase [Bacteroidota bacterium]MBU1680086.1 type 2 isopentenyl-diphosphate Delta-isomerase [Bacteroidota bacterium]MBU2507899.1 type 2 isopentenyl-diphosphate Delta-isomerase [Bacteroidota bacterium]
MHSKATHTSKRKKDHISICLKDDLNFITKTTGFENYEFEHFAATEVNINKIDLSSLFFRREIRYPFLISCMTGGTIEADSINAKLAEAAQNLNIPIGVGSQRQAIESNKNHNSYKIIRKIAKDVPVLSNIGAAQIAGMNSMDDIHLIIDLIEADALVIHLNPLQELLQPEGETYFKGLLKNIKKIKKRISVPVIVKEVGSGIGKKTAKILLNNGVDGIDVAGSGGTSWAGVELIRKGNREEKYFWDWGLPTSYCIKKLNKLKKKNNFLLIGSGGINDFDSAAKALVLGADIVASARILLIEAEKGVKPIVDLIENWFENIKKIMFLTGASNLTEFKKTRLIKKKDLY